MALRFAARTARSRSQLVPADDRRLDHRSARRRREAITAQGPGADKLGRVQQNTDVHDSIQEAMGFKKAKKAKRKGR